MKTILATLCLIVASANALSLDALRNLITEELTKRESSDEISLGEYLRTTEPAAKFREVRRDESDLDCEMVCGHAQIKLDTNQVCESKKWRPNYIEHSGCECLTGYLCCTGRCENVKLESCWEMDNSKKGSLFGTWITDCCGCPAVKCVTCPEVDPKPVTCPTGEGARPLDCYKYTKFEHHKNSSDQCFESHCTESASDADPDEICDSRCEKDSTRTTHCLFDHNVCEGLTAKEDCVNVEKKPLELDWPEKCYEAPEEVDDDAGGHYYHATMDKCMKCTKWTYKKLSCAIENALAAAEDCHQFGSDSMDRTCFQKTTVKDVCQCDVAECNVRVAEIPDVFAPEHECPKDHVKQEGVDICLKRRDICKKCPAVALASPSDCPKGRVEETTDCNGCKKVECKRAEVPSDACECLRYRLDLEANALFCDC